MKRNVTVFPSRTYITTTGAPTRYFHELDLADVLGQGKALRIQVLGSRRSDTARATIRFTKPGDARPSQWGKEIGTGTQIPTSVPRCST